MLMIQLDSYAILDHLVHKYWAHSYMLFYQKMIQTRFLSVSLIYRTASKQKRNNRLTGNDTDLPL